jgi:hypothetical protein
MAIPLAGLGEFAGAFTKQFQVSAQLAKDLFGFQTKAEKQAIKFQENEQNFQHALGGLSNQQGYVLQQQLNGAKNATERYAILADAVTKIKQTGLTNSNVANTQKTILIIGVIVLAIVVLIVVKRK